MKNKYSFKDKIQAIGGFLILMYAVILIGFIWFDFGLMFKILLTNTVLVALIWFMDNFS